ncbi:MAG: M28 family peptidase [Bacteroidales bacterium]
MRSSLVLFSLFQLFISCQSRFEPEITTPEIKEHITYLASDELAGRYPGSRGDLLLADYITRNYKAAGLKLFERSGLQHFDIVTDIEAGPNNSAAYNGVAMEPGIDFSPISFSDNGSLTASLVFAGFGFSVNQDELKYDDYQSVDPSGKWVMILRGVPGKQEPSSPFINYSEDRGKALQASDLGAAGVILVSGEGFDPNDALEELKGKQHPLSIPVIQVTRNMAERIFSAAGKDSLVILERQISTNVEPASFASSVELSITVDLQPKVLETSNTIAFLEGSDPVLKGEYVIIGAHHDHLGTGGPGSSSRAPDTMAVHYGADDNASGVAGVLEISEYMVIKSPARSMVFTTFGAEEMGLVGSKYLMENPPVDPSEIQVMINLDMVGRLNEERQLQIGGVGTSPGFAALLDSLNQNYGFSLKYANEGYGPSDHAAFYAKDVPVLFISTGAHAEYHTPSDNASSINMEGAKEVISFTADIAEAFANIKERITFVEAGPKVPGSSRGLRGGITLGLMPDMNYDGSEGMPVMFVTEGKPAAVGGIQKGDVIIAIEGKSVGNVYDYMSRLGQLKAGMDIVVTVKRGDDKMEILVRI